MKDVNGNSVYGQLTQLLGSMKDASRFLHEECDINGMKYPANHKDGTKGYNYVSYSDENMRIDEHTKWMVSKNMPATVVTLPSIPNVDLSDTEALREYLLTKFRGMEVTIKYDGRPTKFTDGGIRATLKRRSIHREAYDSFDELVRESYPVGYEKVDKRHEDKRDDLRGQFVYASLFKGLDETPYVAIIKFDDSLTTMYAQYKDLSIQEMPPLYVGQTKWNSNVDSPADGIGITIQQVVDFDKSKIQR